jgi:hypothetical protein
VVPEARITYLPSQEAVKLLTGWAMPGQATSTLATVVHGSVTVEIVIHSPSERAKRVLPSEVRATATGSPTSAGRPQDGVATPPGAGVTPLP